MKDLSIFHSKCSLIFTFEDTHFQLILWMSMKLLKGKRKNWKISTAFSGTYATVEFWYQTESEQV